MYQLNIIKKIRKTTKKARKRYQHFSKKEKEKSNNMVVNVTKISQTMKKKLVEYRKKYYRMRKKALL